MMCWAIIGHNVALYISELLLKKYNICMVVKKKWKEKRFKRKKKLQNLASDWNITLQAFVHVAEMFTSLSFAVKKKFSGLFIIH